MVSEVIKAHISWFHRLSNDRILELLQDIDQLTLMRPLCKMVARITRVRDIIPVLRKAICTAQSDTPGPVFVEIPIDVLYPFELVLKGTETFKTAHTFRKVFTFLPD